MDITIYGSGYVGLVTGACLSEVGHHVLCVDIDTHKIDLLKEGNVPIFEPGLEDMIRHNVRAGRLNFTTCQAEGAAHGVFQFVAVGTPPDEDGSADLKYVRAVASSIGRNMTDHRVICVKSTVPVGSSDQIRKIIAGELKTRGAQIEFDVVSNPEFLKEGAAIRDFMKPDRIIVGTDSGRATALLHSVYAPFTRNHDCMIVMDIRSAELTKYAANAMLATRISFMNELANIAERVGANVERVRVGIGSDPRIGYQFLYPGCGYGGSCFPKDVSALIQTALEVGYESEILQAVDSVNEKQKRVLLHKITAHFKGRLTGRTFALWGLAFKPGTDDLRAAPSQVVIEELLRSGATIRAFDPAAMEAAGRHYGELPGLLLCETKEAALQGADALIVITDWMEFRSPDFPELKGSLIEPVIFDGRNLYDAEELAQQGITYYGIGTGVTVHPLTE